MKKYTSLMAKIAIVIALVTVILELTNAISSRTFIIAIILTFLLWGICTYLEGTHRKKGDKSGWLELRKNAFKGKKK